MFRKTRLSDKFAMEDAKEKLPDAANMLLLLRPDGKMRFFTHASAPEPTAGDTVISYSPPDPSKAAGRAAERRSPAKAAKAQPA